MLKTSTRAEEHDNVLRNTREGRGRYEKYYQRAPQTQHFPRIFDTEIAAKRVYQAYKLLGIAPKMFLYLFRENWYKRIFTKKYLRDTF